MESRNEIKYINGLKGFACVMIMCGHYLGFYKYAEAFPGRFGGLDLVLNSKFAFLLSESFWLYLFFIVSGFLIARSKINTFSELVKKCILRVLRLSIPILFSYGIIFFLYKLIGFHNAEAIDGFANKWFQGFYTESVSLKNVLLAPIEVLFQKKTLLNPHYWCLSSMLVASIVIYVYTYLSKKVKMNDAWFYLLLIALLISLHYKFCGVRTAVLIGLAAKLFLDWADGKLSIQNNDLFCFTMIGVSLLLYMYYEWIILATIFAIFFIYAGKCKWTNSVLSSKPFVWLGKISWGVYSFHFPIFCSVGVVLMKRLEVSLLHSFLISSRYALF